MLFFVSVMTVCNLETYSKAFYQLEKDGHFQIKVVYLSWKNNVNHKTGEFTMESNWFNSLLTPRNNFQTASLVFI